MYYYYYVFFVCVCCALIDSSILLQGTKDYALWNAIMDIKKRLYSLSLLIKTLFSILLSFSSFAWFELCEFCPLLTDILLALLRSSIHNSSFHPQSGLGLLIFLIESYLYLEICCYIKLSLRTYLWTLIPLTIICGDSGSERTVVLYLVFS